MHPRLLSWARAVKARQARLGPHPLGRHNPVLWLFTDAVRLPDPLPAIARLPPGLCGVVFRHDGVAGREELGRAVAALCRCRGIALSVAGDGRLAASLHAGMHVRAHASPSSRAASWRRGDPGQREKRLSRGPGSPRRFAPRDDGQNATVSHRPRLLSTGSAHTVAELRQLARRGVRLAFLSPVFPTASHPGAPTLGVVRWQAMARAAPKNITVLALGGIDLHTARRLPRSCAGIGAIGALMM